MDAPTYYSVAEVLAVASKHPFYNPQIQYPLDRAGVRAAREYATKGGDTGNLEGQPLLLKHSLYATVQRLFDDTSPDNSYRRSVYASTTGGGTGGRSLFFVTDVNENRQQRATFGSFLNMVGLVEPTDWVLTMHTSGRLYRALDLTQEILENAQASVLSAGSFMTPAEVTKMLVQYHVNVLTGDGSQIVEIVHHISGLSEAERRLVRLDKVVYTSEPLTTSQRRFIRSVLGKSVKIWSILGSAEFGAFAASCGDLAAADGGATVTTGTYTDFIYDTRAMVIEIFSMDSLDRGSLQASELPPPPPPTVADGEQGLVAQTSLVKLRNPLVRYITGDVGSLHPVPDTFLASLEASNASEHQYFKILRLYGRDRRSSFSWDGEYFDMGNLEALLENRDGDDGTATVLQWQVVLDRMPPPATTEAKLTFRLLLMSAEEDEQETQRIECLYARLRTFFSVAHTNERRFEIVSVRGLDGFQRSVTGNKVIKFVDRFSD